MILASAKKPSKLMVKRIKPFFLFYDAALEEFVHHQNERNRIRNLDNQNVALAFVDNQEVKRYYEKVE